MIGEIEEIKIYVNDETYTKYKKTLEDEIENLQQENQELKRNCNIGYENLNFYREENQSLKKQLEEYENELEKADSITQSCIFNGKKESEISFRKCLNMLEKHKNQQKEFIEYLEDLIKQNETVVEVSKYGLPKNCSKLLIDFYKEILSKYKEIIGDVKNENK